MRPIVFAAQLPPDLLRAVHLEVVVPHPVDLGAQQRIALPPGVGEIEQRQPIVESPHAPAFALWLNPWVPFFPDQISRRDPRLSLPADVLPWRCFVPRACSLPASGTHTSASPHEAVDVALPAGTYALTAGPLRLTCPQTTGCGVLRIDGAGETLTTISGPAGVFQSDFTGTMQFRLNRMRLTGVTAATAAVIKAATVFGFPGASGLSLEMDHVVADGNAGDVLRGGNSMQLTHACPLLSADQRGFTRPIGLACDIGAVELVCDALPGPAGVRCPLGDLRRQVEDLDAAALTLPLLRSLDRAVTGLEAPPPYAKRAVQSALRRFIHRLSSLRVRRLLAPGDRAALIAAAEAIRALL